MEGVLRYRVGRLENLPLDPSLSIKKDIMWADSNPVDQLQLVIHNRNDKPINLNSVGISYYLNKLVFKDLGNTPYRLAYGNKALSSPHYDIMDYKTSLKRTWLEPSQSADDYHDALMLTQATLGAEVSTPANKQLPENSTNHKLIFNLTISALALLLVAGIGLSLWRKNSK